MSKTYKGQTLSGTKNKKLRIFLKIMLVLLIILVLFFSVVAWYAYNKLSKLNYVQLENIEINEGVTEQLKGYRNIVLFGVDARANTYDNTRSDCIIIASINQDTNEVKMTSIYRDTYVYIDGYGYDKITHAYAYGGPQLAINTINKNFDLNISEFVAVNFDAVVEIIDAVKGVNITIESEELKYINNYINGVDQQMHRKTPKVTKTGNQTLSGVQALAYSRIRYTSGGDYKRTERMRDVLNAGFNKIKTLGIGELNRLADILLPKVYTNIKSTEVLAMIPDVTKYKVTSSIGWPYEIKGITLDRWYGVPVTLESNVKQLHKDLFGNENYEVSPKVKEYSEGIIKRTGYRK
ncbi:MAG: LytR family transcriptional regulator [Clostridiales bacterium]|nr:LytR family transcriptional regulator [Clostridiales bacterium]